MVVGNFAILGKDEKSKIKLLYLGKTTAEMTIYHIFYLYGFQSTFMNSYLIMHENWVFNIFCDSCSSLSSKTEHISRVIFILEIISYK